MRTKLLVKDQTSGEFIDVPLVSDIPVSITYQQADVREPDKRNSSFSRSIEIYASNEINILFENLFDVNIVTNTFNPNKKSQCKYLFDELEQFNGALQLVKIVKRPDNNIVYVCNINGNEGNVFIDIGDALLTDLDFSSYDHTYNRTNILASWSSYVAGTGYYYPFVDNGSNGGSQLNFKVEQFIPCFHAIEYVDKILTNAGYTFISPFLTGAEFKRNIIYPNLSTAKLTDAQLAQRQWYVGLNSNINAITEFQWNGIAFNNESAPFFDTSPAIHSGGVATITQAGKYNLTFKLNSILTANNNADTNVDQFIVSDYTHKLRILKSSDGGVTWFGLGINSTNLGDATYNFTRLSPSSISADYESYLTVNPILLGAGDLIKCEYWVEYSYEFYDSVNANIVTLTSNSVAIKSGSTGSAFYGLAATNEIGAGETIFANSVLPQNIKQKDFLKWIMQMYNLFIDVDKEDATKLTIEPYTTYFRLTEGASSIVNWDNKIDLDNPFEVNPLFLLEGREYEYTYKSDKDYYNQRYEKEYAEIFGRHKVFIDNDFMSQTKKNEIGFSPTPNVENNVIGAIYPKIYENTGTEIKPITSNIRILYANPSLTTNNPYNFTDSSVGTTIQTTAFGYAGHTDNPLDPTIDLNFYFPKTVYYTFPELAFTTGNLYNKYHKSYLENITGRDSKTIVANLWLNSLDIANFTFRKKYFIDNAYYIVNKIIDYNPLMERSTKVELIKIVDASVFTPQKYPVITLGAIDRGDKLPIRPIRVDGTNINYSESSVQFGGLNTFISADSERVFLVNCENVQVIGASDFVGVGLKDITIDSTYNGKTVNTSIQSLYAREVASPTYTALTTDQVLDVRYGGAAIDISNLVSVRGAKITIKNAGGDRNISISANQSPVYLIDIYDTIEVAPFDSVTLVNVTEETAQARFIIV